MKFRLRTLFFLLVVCGAGLSWCLAITRQHAAETAAIKQLRKISTSGRILAEDNWDRWCFAHPMPDVRSIAPRWLDDCLRPWGCDRFDHVSQLTLDGREFDDHIVDHLTTFTSLKKLKLNGTSMTESGLCRLKDALPRTHIEFIDWRDVDVRSPVGGEILYVAKEGTSVKPGDVLVKLKAGASGKQYMLYAKQDGTVRNRPIISVGKYPAERIGEGTIVRELQLVVIIQPSDSLTTLWR